MIRPPDSAIVGPTLTYMPIGSAEAVRRLVHLAFRDAHTALDLTAAHRGFWRGPCPPGLAIASNNLDPNGAADLHVDFTATGLPDGAYDLVVFDPPHIADGGAASIMAARYGTVKGVPALREMLEDGAREAWRIASVGVLVKVADHSHGSELLLLSDWIKGAVPARPYTVLHTFRPGYLHDGKRRAERVPRNNGATYLAFRKDGHQHRDFDRLYARQDMSRLADPGEHRRCAICDRQLGERRRDAATCSDACRQRARRQRRHSA
jgi:hypothetical protein